MHVPRFAQTQAKPAYVNCESGGWGAGFPSKTMLQDPRITSIPRGILIHSTVWPQYTNVTSRQTGQTDRTDNVSEKGSPKKDKAPPVESKVEIHIFCFTTISENVHQVPMNFHGKYNLRVRCAVFDIGHTILLDCPTFWFGLPVVNGLSHS